MKSTITTPLLTCLLLASVLGAAQRSASAVLSAISEPDTVLYGKIFDHSGGGARQLFSGHLECTVRREADGAEFELKGEVAPLRGGLSYRIGLPHQAVGEGIEASAGAAPLTGEEVIFRITSASYGGSPAYLLPPASPAFSASQLLRASAHRIDFEASADLQDRDGDGMPDWWEEQHGLDPFSAADALTDADGDGLTNLVEFLGGSHPLHSDSAPSLADARLIYYPGIASGVYLRAFDSDTPATGLTFELLNLPATGTLSLHSVAGETALEAGVTFSGADLEAGRLIFHTGPGETAAASFQVRVTDGTPGHDPDEAVVELVPYLMAESNEPNSPRAEIAGTLLQSTVIWDVSSLGLPTVIRPEEVPGEAPLDGVFFGGASADVFSGGKGPDIFFGGPGEDAFTGGAGADRFGFLAGPASGGTDRVTDFSIAEGDVVDLSYAFTGSSSVLEDYVRLSINGEGTRFEIDTDGEGSTFADGALFLEGVPLSEELASLWDRGLLLLPDGIFPATVVGIDAIESAASENGLAGLLRVRRIGDLSKSLTVSLRVSGSASNGVDYAFLEESIHFTSGQAERDLVVEPLADAFTENAEVVDIAVVNGTDYTPLSVSESARVTIADLMGELSLAVLEPMATLDPVSSGYVVLTRKGALNEGLLARLEISGDAVLGTHIVSLPRFVDLSSGERSRIIEIAPVPGAELGAGRVVRLSLEADSSYLVGSSSGVEITIVPRRLSLAAWRDAHFPEESNFAVGDFALRMGPAGVSHLQAYALGQMDAAGSPLQIVRADGHTMVEYRRPLGVADVDYRLEISTDLREWNSAEESVWRLWPIDLAPGTVRYGLHEQATDAYFRLNLELK